MHQLQTLDHKTLENTNGGFLGIMFLIYLYDNRDRVMDGWESGGGNSFAI